MIYGSVVWPLGAKDVRGLSVLKCHSLRSLSKVKWDNYTITAGVRVLGR